MSALQNQQLLPQAEVLGDQPHLDLNAAAIAQTRKRTTRPPTNAGHRHSRGASQRLSTTKPMGSHFAPHSGGSNNKKCI
jgi:hypothetical protein